MKDYYKILGVKPSDDINKIKKISKKKILQYHPDKPNGDNDMFLKEYTTALIKQQWGMNLIKFEGMQLPGGVVLNGRQIYDDATSEIATLRENLRLEHEFPPDFFVG